MKGENPIYKGMLTSEEKDPKKSEQIGNVALWQNKSQNAKAPLFTGSVQTAIGRKYG